MALTTYLILFGLLQSACSMDPQLELLKELINSGLGTAAGQNPLEANATNYQYRTQIELLFAQLGAQVFASKRAQEFVTQASKFGIPSGDSLRYFDNYIVSYDKRLKQPSWVLQRLVPAEITKKVAVRHGSHTFCMDRTIHEYFRTTDKDYKTSGYDRGHFAPALDNIFDQDYLDQSFYLSNVAPQVPNLNRAGCVWARLETYVRYVARRSKHAYVLTGSLYLPSIHDSRLVRYRIIGSNRVAVPTHFYKILVSEEISGQISMEAYSVPNSPHVVNSAKLEQFQIDIDTQLPILEESAGLVFFDNLNRKRVAKPLGLQYGFGKGKVFGNKDY